jgi:hypothetical protein
MRVFAAFFACAALVARVAAQPVSNGGNYELPLRTLVLTTQSVLSDYPRWVMNAMQQPFDLYQLVDDDATVPNEKAGQVRKKEKSWLLNMTGISRLRPVVRRSSFAPHSPDSRFATDCQSSKGRRQPKVQLHRSRDLSAWVPDRR